MTEAMSTTALIKWVLERDAEDRSEDWFRTSRHNDTEDEDDPIDEPIRERNLGPRGESLLEIAQTVGADVCVKRLERWKKNLWLREPSPPRVQSVTGVIRKQVWIRSFHVVYTVLTNRGPAYLYAPDERGAARIVLEGLGPSAFQTIRLSQRILGELQAFRSRFDELQQVREGR